MRAALIGCPFRTTYGYYFQALLEALGRSGMQTEWVASNCGCTDPHERLREFQREDIKYFELMNDVGGYSLISYSPETWRRVVKAPYRNYSLNQRVARYAELTKNHEIVHLQQTLNAFGSSVAFRMLNQPISGARVITVHELDPEQTAKPETNRSYNLADAIIVHDTQMKERLIAQGVAEELVHVVCMGTELANFNENESRVGIAFYGGHHLNKGKGFETLVEAVRQLRESGFATPKVFVHGHFGSTPSAFSDLVRQKGLEADVVWLGDIKNEEIVELYRKCMVCVLPYTASFAGLPVGIAAANRLPVIGTKYAGIPDHIGDLAVSVEAGDPARLAQVLHDVLKDKSLRADLGQRLQKHAERFLGWDQIAVRTLAVYEAARQRASRDKRKRTVG